VSGLEPLAVRVEEAAQMIRASRATMFELVRDGKIPTVLINERLRRVPIAEIKAYLARLQREQQGENQRGEVARV
jgi:excisionase family DNA binding protein